MISAACALLLCNSAHALNIVVSNDDGLTSNVKALYSSLKAAGHDVIVSVPCTQQSGRGGGVVMYSTTTINALADTDITKDNGCRNGAAAIGDPSAGPMKKADFTNGDWHYAHGTPVMALMYGLDVPAMARWNQSPDLVISGPNEGFNLGSLNITSGTVGISQFALIRGIPAIAISASSKTVDDAALANPKSEIAAALASLLVKALSDQAKTGKLLPAGMALNVNIPDSASVTMPFAFSKQGSFDLYEIGFTSKAPFNYRLVRQSNPATAEAHQKEDESVVVSDKISVSAMQMAYEARPAAQEWLRLRIDQIRTK